MVPGLVFLVVVLVFPPVPHARSDSVDFGNLEPRSAEPSPRTPVPRSRNLTRHRSTIWSGAAPNLQLETGLVQDQVLWVAASNTELHISHGTRREFYPGDRVERIPGQLVLLDLHSLPRDESRALITLIYFHGDQLRTRIYAFEAGSNPRLARLHEENWTAIRPVGDLLYAQSYDRNRLWLPTIYRLRTTRAGYEKSARVKFPEGTRLTSLTEIDPRRHVYVNENANLVYTLSGRVLDQIDGTYGASTEMLTPRGRTMRESTEKEPVFLPPAFLPDANLIAVAENPLPRTGLRGWLFGGETPSSLQLFRPLEDRFETVANIGPFQHRILDVEVPEANPSQLLWLRRRADGDLVLEMIDFDNLNRS